MSFQFHGTQSHVFLIHVQVKWRNTINEPKILAMGYSVLIGLVPNILTSGHGQYLTLHTALLSHARAYGVYEREFKAKQGGECCALSNVGRELSAAHACNDRGMYCTCV